MLLSNSLSNYSNIILGKYQQSLRNESTKQSKYVAFISSVRRVISCLVNEQLVASSLIKITKTSNYKFEASEGSLWVVLQNKKANEHRILIPIAKKISEKNINFDIENGTVHFLDPSDLGQVVLSSRNQSTHFEPVREIKQIFETLLVDSTNISAISKIIDEINDSIKHQILVDKESRPFIPLWRLPIEYEQAIHVGHATHPMSRSRVPMPQMTVNAALYDFRKIKIYFYKVAKSAMNIYGSYEDVIQNVAKKLNISYDREMETIIPVHELQKEIVNKFFNNNLQLQEVASTSALSQCSLRSVDMDSIRDYTFKLSLGMVITSAMRTITHWSAYHGPGIAKVLQKIMGSNENLCFLNELGSIIVKNDDFNVSKHFACIVRENVSAKLSDLSETAIVCAYLTEMSNEKYNITQLFALKSQTDRDNFSDCYAKLLIDSLFHFVYEYGFSFEAHQQNVLLKLRKSTEHGFELIGFIVRDFGGIKVHQETLHSKIGMTVSVLDDDASILADCLEDVYTVCHHTLFHSHLLQIFRSLGTHDNGRGWRFVREHLNTKKEFLANERCAKFFFAKMAPYKCFIKMKLFDFEREYMYTDVPNVINFNQI